MWLSLSLSATDLMLLSEEELVHCCHHVLVQINKMFVLCCVLKVQHCLESEYERTNGCLIIPRGTQFGQKLFPEIVIPRNHAAPYPDPTTGKEAPFMTVGTFSSMDPMFPGIAGDWQLYTTQEVVHLRSTGVLRPSAAPSLSISTLPTLASLAQMQSAPITPGLPKMDLGSPRVELDLSSKRQEDLSSLKGHKCQVSAATGSSTSLEKSDEWDHDADHKGHEKDRERDKNCKRSRDCECKADHGHPKHRSLHCEHATGHDHSVSVKHI